MKHKGLKLTLVLLAVALAVTGTLWYVNYDKETKAKQEQLAQQQEAQVEVVKTHYSKIVVTSRVTGLYQKIDGQFELRGSIGKNIEVNLWGMEIGKGDEYFPLADLPGYFVDYKDVMPKDETQASAFIDTRFNSLIPFDQNVVTTNKTDFYQTDGSIYVSINEGVSLPLIVNEDSLYGVSYLGRLLWINKSQATLEAHENSDAQIATQVRTLCYHKMYDKTKTSCNTVICHELGQMRSHFNYLTENGYYFMSMQDMVWWLKGQIQIPYNSLCLTFDDGGDNTVILVSLLNEYKIHGTLFLIGSLYYDAMRSDYLELQSHTYDLHKYGECNLTPRGSAFVCRSTEEVTADVLKSKNLTNAIAFCYPFYEYTEQRKELIKSLGFKLAFGDDYGLIDQGSDPYMLSRYTCVSSTSVQEMAYALHHD